MEAYCRRLDCNPVISSNGDLLNMTMNEIGQTSYTLYIEAMRDGDIEVQLYPEAQEASCSSSPPLSTLKAIVTVDSQAPQFRYQFTQAPTKLNSTFELLFIFNEEVYGFGPNGMLSESATIQDFEGATKYSIHVVCKKIEKPRISCCFDIQSKT